MIMVLLGRSGCGKSSIAKRLAKNYDYRTVRTCTTRARRDGEPEDAYHFMDRLEFLNRELNGEFAEFAYYGGNYYGTLKADLDTADKLVAVITPEGAAAYKKVIPETFVVHVDTSMKTAVLGAVGREEALTRKKLETICNRACEDEGIFGGDLPSDFTIVNTRGTSLDVLARLCAEKHEEFVKSIQNK